MVHPQEDGNVLIKAHGKTLLVPLKLASSSGQLRWLTQETPIQAIETTFEYLGHWKPGLSIVRRLIRRVPVIWRIKAGRYMRQLFGLSIAIRR